MVLWKSTSTNIEGRIQSQFTYQSGDSKCRRIRFVFREGKKGLGAFKFDFCQHKGSWKITQTPASAFSQGDWAKLKEELNYALTNAADGQSVLWGQPDSKFLGVIVPISIFDQSRATSDGKYLFCRDGKGNWARVNE